MPNKKAKQRKWAKRKAREKIKAYKREQKRLKRERSNEQRCWKLLNELLEIIWGSKPKKKKKPRDKKGRYTRRKNEK